MTLISERNMLYKRTVIHSSRIRINYLSKHKYLPIINQWSYFLSKSSNNKIIFLRHRWLKTHIYLYRYWNIECGSPSPAREKNKDIVCLENGFKLGVEQRVRIYKQNLAGLDVSLSKIYLSKKTHTSHWWWE